MEKTDTTPQAKQVQIDLYRRMSPAERVELVFDAYRTGKMLAMAGIREQYPSAGERQLWHIWAKRHLGEDLYNKIYSNKK